MPSVGSETFLTVAFDPSVAGEEVKEITRAHVDGRAFKRVGRRGTRPRLVARRDIDTLVSLEAKRDAYKAMQGTLQTVINDQGVTMTNILIQRVLPITVQDILTPSGGIHGADGKYMVTQVFECVDTNV